MADIHIEMPGSISSLDRGSSCSVRTKEMRLLNLTYANLPSCLDLRRNDKLRDNRDFECRFSILKAVSV